jgi:hypothetical protein
MDLPDGYSVVADFNGDGKPEVVLVASQATQAKVWILNGADGSPFLGPVTLPTTVHGSIGGPPAIVASAGNGPPRIGVATSDYYWLLEPDPTHATINILWHVPIHNYAASQGAAVSFDFEGNGNPAIVFGDECYLWVLDGETGQVRFSTSRTSNVATSDPIVADLDGDGHAEILYPSAGVDPSNTGWGCLDATGNPVTINGARWQPGTVPNKSYRGLVELGSPDRSWVATRTLWNEHTYHVTNICDDTDHACPAPNVYGAIPKVETLNWTLPWLNNFRENARSTGLFDAPDAAVTLAARCSSPPTLLVDVRNVGQALLPSGVTVGVYEQTADGGQTLLTTLTTTHALGPNQTEPFAVAATAGSGTYVAAITNTTTFAECRTDNDSSAPVVASCGP